MNCISEFNIVFDSEDIDYNEILDEIEEEIEDVDMEGDEIIIEETENFDGIDEVVEFLKEFAINHGESFISEGACSFGGKIQNFSFRYDGNSMEVSVTEPFYMLHDRIWSFEDFCKENSELAENAQLTKENFDQYEIILGNNYELLSDSEDIPVESEFTIEL